MSDKSFLWAIIIALLFILTNAFFHEKHYDRLNQIAGLEHKETRIKHDEMRMKYDTIKAFLADTGMADEEWLSKN